MCNIDGCRYKHSKLVHVISDVKSNCSSDVAGSLDLSDSVTELIYSMLKSFMPQMCISIEEENILLYIMQWINLS